MGQEPDALSPGPAETPNKWGSITLGSQPERRTIPTEPHSEPVEQPQVVATTPLSVPIAPTTTAPAAPPRPVTAEPHDPRVIRADIAQTRAEMSSTLDAIQERLDPQRLVEEAKDAAKDAVQGAVQETTGAVRAATLGKAEQMANEVTDTARGASSTIMDTLRQNPVPTALAAIGLGWLWVSSRSGSSASSPTLGQARGYPTPRSPSNSAQDAVGSARATVGGLADQATDTAGQVVANAQDLVSGATSSASQAVSSAGHAAGGASSSVLDTIRQNPVPTALVGLGLGWLLRGRAKEQAGGLSDQVQAQAQQAQGQLQHVMNDNPLALGAIALGLGAALGFAAPGTRQESQLMGEARDCLMETAQSMAQETQQKVQQVAQQAQHAATQEAQRQNLTA